MIPRNFFLVYYITFSLCFQYRFSKSLFSRPINVRSSCKKKTLPRLYVLSSLFCLILLVCRFIAYTNFFCVNVFFFLFDKPCPFFDNEFFAVSENNTDSYHRDHKNCGKNIKQDIAHIVNRLYVGFLCSKARRTGQYQYDKRQYQSYKEFFLHSFYLYNIISHACDICK